MQTQPIATFALDEDQPRRPYVKRGTKRTPPVPAYTHSSSTPTTNANTAGPRCDTSSASRVVSPIVSSPATQEPESSNSHQGRPSETEEAGPASPPTRQTNHYAEGMYSTLHNTHSICITVLTGYLRVSWDARGNNVTEVNNAPGKSIWLP